jgi:hypothetical protein
MESSGVGRKRAFGASISRSSRLAVRAYCARHGLSEPSFYSWRAEIARRDAERPKRPAFVPVIVGAGAPAPTVEFQLPGGLIIRVPAHDREALGAVWELVKVPSCSA